MLLCNFIEFISNNVNDKYVRIVYKDSLTLHRYTLFVTNHSQNINNVFDEYFQSLIDNKQDRMIDLLLNNNDFQVLNFNDNSEIIIVLTGVYSIHHLLKSINNEVTT